MTVSTEVATPPQSTKWKLRFLGISRYKIKFDLNSYRRVWVSGLGGFRGCIIFSGNCDCELCELLPAPVRLLCCSVLQCVAVCCSVLQCFAERCDLFAAEVCPVPRAPPDCVEVCRSALKCVAVCWNVLQCVEVCCSVLKCVAVRWSVLQCVEMSWELIPAQVCPALRAPPNASMQLPQPIQLFMYVEWICM